MVLIPSFNLFIFHSSHSHPYLCHNHKDTEPLYHSFMYSLVSLLFGIYPLPAMHSLLVTLSSDSHMKMDAKAVSLIAAIQSFLGIGH